jgi:hypothetical protein
LSCIGRCPPFGIVFGSVFTKGQISENGFHHAGIVYFVAVVLACLCFVVAEALLRGRERGAAEAIVRGFVVVVGLVTAGATRAFWLNVRGATMRAVFTGTMYCRSPLDAGCFVGLF